MIKNNIHSNEFQYALSISSPFHFEVKNININNSCHYSPFTTNITYIVLFMEFLEKVYYSASPVHKHVIWDKSVPHT
jgi:hypothetical protein